VDTRTPVDDTDYQVPFRFTGKLAKLTFNLGPEQLSDQDRQTVGAARAAGHDER
jgi:arylsulfatase